MTGAELELRGLRVAYGAREILRGIDVHIAPGERVALLGENGAGKSTLLRAITRLVRHGGSVLLDGRPLEEYSSAEIARFVAVVPAQNVLAFPLPVEEFVTLGRIPHEHPLLGPREPDRAAVAAAIERVGIGHLVGRDVRELSLGERQLVLLAMTVAQGARLLLLDEPTVHLDLRHQVRVMRLIAQLAEDDGVTVLTVLHDLGLARHFFPRTLLLHGGRLVADGSPAHALTPELLGEVYDVEPELVALLRPGG